MATQDPSGREPLSTGRVLFTLGIVTTVFSVAVGLLVLFFIPGGCTFLSGLELVILAGLFLIGLVALLAGKLLLHKMTRTQAKPGDIQ